jgi:hypothetical protein
VVPNYIVGTHTVNNSTSHVVYIISLYFNIIVTREGKGDLYHRAREFRYYDMTLMYRSQKYIRAFSFN